MTVQIAYGLFVHDRMNSNGLNLFGIKIGEIPFLFVQELYSFD